MEAETHVSTAIQQLHLYVLGQNGLFAAAAAEIASLDGRGHPSVEQFLSWFTTRFELSALESDEPGTRPEPLASAR